MQNIGILYPYYFSCIYQEGNKKISLCLYNFCKTSEREFTHANGIPSHESIKYESSPQYETQMSFIKDYEACFAKAPAEELPPQRSEDHQIGFIS